MLTISLEKLAYIVEKAREYDGEVPADPEAEDGSDAADDDERQILLDTPDNPTEQELRDAIDGLNVDEREELLALYGSGAAISTPRAGARRSSRHATCAP